MCQLLKFALLISLTVTLPLVFNRFRLGWLYLHHFIVLGLRIHFFYYFQSFHFIHSFKFIFSPLFTIMSLRFKTTTNYSHLVHASIIQSLQYYHQTSLLCYRYGHANQTLSLNHHPPLSNSIQTLTINLDFLFFCYFTFLVYPQKYQLNFDLFQATGLKYQSYFLTLRELKEGYLATKSFHLSLASSLRHSPLSGAHRHLQTT